jgi:uncharacterized lipoprotein YmbA
MKKQLSVLCLSWALAACGTSPEPDFYALAVQPGMMTPQPAFVVKVQRPVLAGYLDRPDFVTQDGAYQVSIDDANQWAEPLDTMFARIFAADIQQRLPGSHVVTEDDKVPGDTRFTLSFNLQRFNATEDGHVLLQGRLFIKDTKADIQPPPLQVQWTIDSGGDALDIAEGLSRTIGCLADQAASALIILDQPAFKTTP